ncbi:MAG: hypothetical protein HFACDABA_03075 [Anaerolineales bacterium]|nr:hypothetical protein [Anaerolineales bacterium]
MDIRKSSAALLKIFILLAAGLMLVNAGRDLFNAAWGSGTWLGLFLPKWGMAFFAFVILSVAGWAVLARALIQPERAESALGPVGGARERTGFLRWIFAALMVVLPPWLFQYSYIGLVFLSPSLRLTVWIACALACGFFLTRGSRFMDWSGLLTGLLVSGGAILLAFPLQGVSAYPFSLGWSEGNRLYDYSILFGRARYIFPANEPLAPFLDLGRQITGGLIFIFPGLTIWQARLWQGVMSIAPYLAVTLAVFWRARKESIWLWLLAGLWGYAFLRQGPIHTPLVFVAFMVALAWRRPLWLAMPLLALAAYIAAFSRFTWIFAPAMWVGMMVFADSILENGRLPRSTWTRAILLAGSALTGGLIYWATGFLSRFFEANRGVDVVGRQPLLWYRLFPNETLGPGILALLIFATLPLIVMLFFLARPPRWTLNRWQKFALLAPLTAFLIVGLIASAKIGGGGDLHNLDMFLIGLIFAVGVAADKCGYRWILDSANPFAMKVTIVLMLAMPVYFPLINMRPLLDAGVFPNLKLLTGAESPRQAGLLPSPAETDATLADIQRRVARVLPGEVLFMDQRQLLTFGYIQVPLISEYEKKLLMDRAMADTPQPIFESFYADLAAHRFALIVSEPLRVPIKGQESIFGEENDAWVKWVSSAVLCYYEPDKTYADVRIQLLVPRETPIECELPIPSFR